MNNGCSKVVEMTPLSYILREFFYREYVPTLKSFFCAAPAPQGILTCLESIPVVFVYRSKTIWSVQCSEFTSDKVSPIGPSGTTALAQSLASLTSLKQLYLMCATCQYVVHICNDLLVFNNLKAYHSLEGISISQSLGLTLLSVGAEL